MPISKFFILLSVLLPIFMIDVSAETKVNLVKTPYGGIQPKVRVDGAGQVHMIYYKGNKASGDVFYVKKTKEGAFSEPIKINSVSGSAVSMGTIRGARFALGSDNMVHVVWNSSRKAIPKGHSGPVMFYARKGGKESVFSKQKVVSGHWHVDGGGAVSVDLKGNVYTFFHSGAEGAAEKDRSVFVSVSKNNGKTFGKSRIISPALGVCGCCAMQSGMDSEGNVYAVYRTATNNKSRDINLLVSKNKGKRFGSRVLEKWPVNSCPMSSMSFLETSKRMMIGWEKDKTIRFSSVKKGTVKMGKVSTPKGGSIKAKHPVFATADNGNILIVWTEGTGWNKGGSIAWQELNASMKPITKTKRLPAGVTTWSFVAVYYDQISKTFNIVH